jgi:hypothetical protein
VRLQRPRRLAARCVAALRGSGNGSGVAAQCSSLAVPCCWLHLQPIARQRVAPWQVLALPAAGLHLQPTVPHPVRQRVAPANRHLYRSAARQGSAWRLEAGPRAAGCTAGGCRTAAYSLTAGWGCTAAPAGTPTRRTPPAGPPAPRAPWWSRGCGRPPRRRPGCGRR